jgi:hypothetical protein
MGAGGTPQVTEKTAANHLGMPLPAGRVRFYRQDQDGQSDMRQPGGSVDESCEINSATTRRKPPQFESSNTVIAGPTG